MTDRRGAETCAPAVPYVVILLTSMGVMVVELAASRLVSRYFGTSLYTWTAVIGVVLGGMCVGNLIGGALADRFPPRELTPVLLLVASALVIFILALDLLLGRILGRVADTGLETSALARSLAAIALLFFLPSAALGTVSPAVAKLVLEDNPRVGNAAGRVYALGSVGSIAGTFLSGFLLIPLLGVRAIIVAVSGMVGLLALALARKKLVPAIWLGLLAVLAILLLIGGRSPEVLSSDYSAYSYIEVRDSPKERRTERVLLMDGLIHNRYDPADPDELLYSYERIFASLTALYASPQSPGLRTLTLGGGAFLFPVYLERHFPGAHQVVEIDPQVVRTARRFFDLPIDSAISVTVADARAFVNSTSAVASGRATYDIVYLDAFNSFSVPAHLTTLEFDRAVRALLAPDGLLVCNLIDIFSVGRFLGAYLRTARLSFPEVAVYEDPGTNRDRRATFVVVCASAPGLPPFLRAHRAAAVVGHRITEEDLALLDARTGRAILTDDHAPVENLIAPVFLRSVR